ncbi:helix-turn-helix domain-containing protein [Haloarcula sp. 1CSR25-25]|uniref:MarR family transcriptional regulator n=1 Tax=Haloarcula sp. 1CSR25-25 TaxID=2862545 RepID=UPI002893BF0C|nr:helix-turn-helix domain-containing protein [Haloarcula sp. 1CSR25-25]MDT3434709.1 MarR family transcriptional regulator [Haloarcula sp. 1CSR25-25]
MTDTSDPMTDPITIPPELADLAPAAKLVYLAVDAHAPVSQGEIRTRTALAGQTVRDALDRLEARGLVLSRPSTDARSVLWKPATG